MDHQAFKIISTAMLSCVMSASYAGAQVVDGVQVTNVSVNGGQDTTNPGTTCIYLAPVAAGTCGGGWIAIMNNNKQLITAAILAQQTNSKIWIAYEDAAPPQHCPWLVFTPCVANSIMLHN